MKQTEFTGFRLPATVEVTLQNDTAWSRIYWICHAIPCNDELYETVTEPIMITLFPASCMNDFTAEERQSAEYICDAINRFVDLNGGDSHAYPSMKEFAAGDDFEDYLEAHYKDPNEYPFFNIQYDENFIKDINFIHAFCMSGGQLSSFINSYGFETIDGNDIVEQAIYHGAQSIALWFHDCSAQLANIKGFELLVANVLRAVQHLGHGGRSPQYMSGRPEISWLGHDALLHCISGEMLESYQGQLTYEQRRLLITLGHTDKGGVQSAVRAFEQCIHLAGDDGDVKNDHLQHILAIGVYTPAYALMLQGVGALEVSYQVKQKAQAILSLYCGQSFEDELSQVLFNALSSFPSYLREIFPLADRWVVNAKESMASVPSLTGPVLGYADPYSACLDASIDFFSKHYGDAVRGQLFEHSMDNPKLLLAMLTQGYGYVKYLDDHLLRQTVDLAFVLPVIERICQFPKAWQRYTSQSVCNAFAPLLGIEIKSTVGGQYAKYFSLAIESHPTLKTFIIDQWITREHVSLVDLKFTGLGSKDIPEMLERLNRDDLTGILEAELGL